MGTDSHFPHGREMVSVPERKTTVGLIVRAQNVKAALAAAKEIAKGPALLRETRHEVDIMVLSLLGQAQREAPVDEGTLRGSGLSKVTFTGSELRGEISFGGLATAYAEVQHERDDFDHPKGGKAHFLYGPGSPWERGQQAAIGRLDRRVGEIAERYIGGAAG